MITIVGADWCPACKRAKKLAKEYDLDYKYVHIPPGQAGWDFVEKLTGRRAIPAVFYRFKTLQEFNGSIDALDLPDRELTEEELDEFD